jgi:hypothetical protein
MRDKKPRNEKSQAHGYWLVYYAPSSDSVWYEGNYVNGMLLGYEMVTIPTMYRYKEYQSHMYHAK